MAVTEPRKKRGRTICVSLRETLCAESDKHDQAESEIAYAKGRVKPLARLLRCATALRVTAPLGCGSRRPVWPKGSLPARPHGPNAPVLGAMLSNAIK